MFSHVNVIENVDRLEHAFLPNTGTCGKACLRARLVSHNLRKMHSYINLPISLRKLDTIYVCYFFFFLCYLTHECFFVFLTAATMLLQTDMKWVEWAYLHIPTSNFMFQFQIIFVCGWNWENNMFQCIWFWIGGRLFSLTKIHLFNANLSKNLPFHFKCEHRRGYGSRVRAFSVPAKHAGSCSASIFRDNTLFL